MIHYFRYTHSFYHCYITNRDRRLRVLFFLNVRFYFISCNVFPNSITVQVLPF